MKIEKDKQARDSLFEGTKEITDVISKTLGSRGKKVIIDSPYGDQFPPIVTADGATVAKYFSINDKAKELGVKIAKQASLKTNSEVGDATSTALVLTNGIVTEGMNRKADDNFNIFKKQLLKDADYVYNFIKENSKEVSSTEDLKRVATISGKDEKTGKEVSKLFDKLGKDAVITTEEGNAFGIFSEVRESISFDKGYASEGFVTNMDKMESVFQDSLVLVTDYKMSSVVDVAGIVDKTYKEKGITKFVIIADDIEGDALAALIMNRAGGVLDVLAIKAPSFGDNRRDVLQDIAIITGATFISEKNALKLTDFKSEFFGKVEKIIATKNKTTIIGGAGDQSKIDERINGIKAELENAEADYVKEKLTERLAMLAGESGVIYVKAPTETETEDMKLQVDDAIKATRAAMEEGIVAGGGVLFAKASENTDILKNALKSPLKQIIENAQLDSNKIIKEIMKSEDVNFGFNVDTEEYGNLIELGVIDPAKVLRVALENAVSTALSIINTAAILVNNDE